MNDKTKAAPTVTDNADGSKDIPLRKPLDVAGAKLSVLRMREPTVEDQLAMDKMPGTDAEKELFMLGNLCGLAPTDLHKLPLKDYRRVTGAYLAFIE
jgi:hypothetical protein